MSNPYFLSENYLLRDATLGEIDGIHAICDIRQFEAGEQILSANGKDQDLMIVIEGRVRVETGQGDKINELRAGAMVGEIGFLDGRGRAAAVFAVTTSKIAIIPAGRLKELMSKTPHLQLVIYRNAALALCQRLRDANQQIEALLVPR